MMRMMIASSKLIHRSRQSATTTCSQCREMMAHFRGLGGFQGSRHSVSSRTRPYWPLLPSIGGTHDTTSMHSIIVQGRLQLIRFRATAGVTVRRSRPSATRGTGFAQIVEQVGFSQPTHKHPRDQHSANHLSHRRSIIFAPTPCLTGSDSTDNAFFVHQPWNAFHCRIPIKPPPSGASSWAALGVGQERGKEVKSPFRMQTSVLGLGTCLGQS